MICPICRSRDSKVLSSRFDEKNQSIKRRRECINCSYRFTTEETIEKRVLLVKKKNGSIEKYNPEKIRLGIEKACGKRQISDELIDKVMNSIENKIDSNTFLEIDSTIIGQYVIEELKNIDEMLYIRYVGVYKNLEDLESLKKVIDEI